MRRAATWISQPRGLSGTPSLGPLQRRREQRLLHRVLGGGEVAEAPDDGAEHLRRQLAQQVLAGEVQRATSQVHGRRAHHLAHLDRHVQRHAAVARAPPTRGRRSRTPAPGVSTSTIQ